MPKIYIEKDKVSYEATSDTSLLDSGLSQGINLPYSCNKGSCGACKCKVLQGQVCLYGEYKPLALTNSDQAQGYTLLCRAYAKTTDVLLELPSSLFSPQVKIFPSQVIAISKLGVVAIIKLQVADTHKFSFLPGQFIDVRFDGKSRSYSIANYNSIANIVELHVKYRSNGAFAQFVANVLQVNDRLKFKGPLGWFKVSSWIKPMILVCTGTGFAPIKAIIEQWLAMDKPNQIYLYWGNSTLEDFYLLDLVKSWCNYLKVSLCLSQMVVPGYFSGYVTDCLQADFSDLSSYDLYACGSVEMIEDVYHSTTTKLQLPTTSFFSDGFTPTL